MTSSICYHFDKINLFFLAVLKPEVRNTTPSEMLNFMLPKDLQSNANEHNVNLLLIILYFLHNVEHTSITDLQYFLLKYVETHK